MATKGTVGDLSSLRKHYLNNDQRKNQSKTWDNLYQGNKMQSMQSQLDVKSDYTELLRGVYNQGEASKGAINSMNIGDSAKKELLRLQNENIESSFVNYSSKLQKDLASIYKSEMETEDAITSQLDDRAERGASLVQANYDYLGELWNRAIAGDSSDFVNDPLMSEYLEFSDEFKEGFDVIDGKFARLKTREELDKTFFSNGKLNIQGADFFDRMMNYNLEDNLSFRDYLSNTDPDLLDWAASYDVYNERNKDVQGSNIGSFKTAVGLTSDDYTYSFVERYGGWSEEKVQESFGKLKMSLDGINLQNSKDVRNVFNTAFDELESYAKQTGIDQYFTKDAMGFTFEELKNELIEYGTRPGGWEQLGSALATSGSTAAAGALLGGLVFGSLGAGAGSVVPFAGTAAGGTVGAGAGAVIGGILGLVGGIVLAGIQMSDTRKSNKQAAKQLQSNFNNVIMSMTEFSLQQRELKQNQFYRV